ncbi:MAG: sugar phosphate isomerase/epimerase [Planctomycetaceae bacterium]|nr:sugar phosphate isomerase/epimerase [Planctomycetaceae bacterium]
MHIAASTRSLWDLAFPAACLQIQDLGFDKVEIWLNETSEQLKPSQVAANPEAYAGQVREASRLSPSAIFLETDVDLPTFAGIVEYAKLLKIAQITIEASPRGTPFNTEIDRLRERVSLCHQEGVRLSILTKTGLLSEDPHTAVELCQSVKGLGITLDPSFFICRTGGSVDFDVVFPEVLHLHLRDTSPTELQVPGGLGVVDYNEIVSRLRQCNFQRTMTIDLFPGTMQGEERLLELRKLRLLLESLI